MSNKDMESRRLDPLVGSAVMRCGQSVAAQYLEWLLLDQGAIGIGKGGAAEGGSLQRLVTIQDESALDDFSLDTWSESLARDHSTVMCTFKNFPAGGPTSWPGVSDEPVAAALGFHRMRSNRPGAVWRPGGSSEAIAPSEDWLPTPSFLAAIFAANAIVAAQLTLRVGEVADVVVPLFSAGLAVLGRRLVRIEAGVPVDPVTRPFIPLSEPYRCRDGRFVQPYIGHSGDYVARLCRAVGHEDWASEAVGGVAGEFTSDADEERWRARFAELFLQRPAAEWEQLVYEAGSSCTMVRDPFEWAAEEHAQATGIVSVGHDGRPSPGPAIRVFSRARQRSVPTDDGGSDWPSIPVDDDVKYVLGGLRVLEFCHIVAGPTCGRALMELGADVIRVDMPTRLVRPDHWLDVHGWLDVNVGKRSIVLDLRTPGGLEVARRLARSADVLVENFRDGWMDGIGLGYAELAEVNPRLIYASLNAFDYGGPWSGRGGWEFNAQAASGMERPDPESVAARQAPYLINDNATGFLEAFGILLALHHRVATGEGSLVRGSLVRTATAALRRIYLGDSGPEPVVVLTCTDGWVRADVRPAASSSADEITEACRWLSVPEAVEFLVSMGCSAMPESLPGTALGQPWVEAADLVGRWVHPDLGPVTHITPRIESGPFALRTGATAESPGMHTHSVLEALGYDAQTIAALAEAGHVEFAGDFVTGRD